MSESPFALSLRGLPSFDENHVRLAVERLRLARDESVRAAENLLDHLKLTPEKSLAGLGGVAEGFSRLPYENVSKVISRAGSESPDQWLRPPFAVAMDHITSGLGGTCFSLTETLRTVVQRLGFEAAPLLADMPHGDDLHCALMVQHRGHAWLLDPGYLICQPLRLDQDPLQFLTPRGMARFVREGSRLALMLPGKERPAYWLKPGTVSESRFVLAWLGSFYIPSNDQLLVTQVQDGEQHYLHNRALRRMDAQGKRNEKLNQDLERRVEEVFGIRAELVHQARTLLNLRRPKKKI